MKLVARTPEAKFKSLQGLLEPGQKAFLQYSIGGDPVIRIKFPTIGAWDYFGEDDEITSADQLTEEEYKII